MTEREALADLLEAVDLAIYSGDWKVDGACDPDAAIQRARNILSQPEFKYLAFMDTPQRTWVGLSDEEIDKIYEAHHNQYGECESVNFGYERAIEAKLKAKNSL